MTSQSNKDTVTSYLEKEREYLDEIQKINEKILELETKKKDLDRAN